MSEKDYPIKSAGTGEQFENLVWIFDSLPDVIVVILNDKFNIVFASKAVSKIINLPIRKVIGGNSGILEKKVPGLSELLDKTIRLNKGIRNKPLELSETDGTIKTFLVSSVVIEEWKKTKNGIILVFHDVSETLNKKSNILQTNRYGDIIGASEIMKSLYLYIETIKDYDTSVLIYGETGTGKELIARSIHFSGKRRRKPFIPIHCAALSENLIESELFGHIKGSYTGAIANRAGRFQTANGGSLFLDEIGTLHMETQTKLLRAIQERMIEPVGSGERIPVDVRIISATNRDLTLLVQKKEFREDLYYRLKVLLIEAPPLRERDEDVLLLTDHFITRLNRYYRKNILGTTENARDMLMRYPWPGNVRELENAIEHAFVLTTGTYIEVKDLPADIRLTDGYGTPPPPVMVNGPAQEEESIKRALLSAGGNKGKATKILGIHRTTLWRKIKEYRIKKNFGKK